MTVREIKSGVGMRILGDVANSPTARVKRTLEMIQVYPDSGWVGINFRVVTDSPKEKTTTVRLNSNTAMELVKGILSNMHDFSVAADEELQAIMKEKLASADKEARAVVQCVTEKHRDQSANQD